MDQEFELPLLIVPVSLHINVFFKWAACVLSLPFIDELGFEGMYLPSVIMAWALSEISWIYLLCLSI